MSLPKPYYDHDGIVIYHGDCLRMHSCLQYGAVIADPPYGMKSNTDSTRFSGGVYGDGRRGQGKVHHPIEGDSRPFDPRRWIDKKWVVLWGANHFWKHLPVGTTLVWIKRRDELFGSFLSDCELAWSKGGHGVYAFRKQFPPPSRMAELGSPRCLHPTQKPLSLMRWCIERSGVPRDAVILDPYAGTGTTLRAAKDLGRRAIGIEVVEAYCEIAARRLAQKVIPFED